MNNKLKVLCITGITAVTLIMAAFAVLIFKNINTVEDESEIVHEADAAEEHDNEAATSAPVKNAATVQPVSDKDNVISSNTEYILQNYYVNSSEGENLTEEKLPVPADFVALNYQKLQNYLDEYIENMPLEEYLNGLISYEIISFDKDKLVLRKTYGTDWNKDRYYICDKDGEIVVYYGDKETVYEYTGLPTEGLSEEDKLKLRLGYFVSDEEELYALLESYSS